MGIGFQFLIMHLGTSVIGFSHADALLKMDLRWLPIYLALMLLGVFALSALSAGAIAGAWCVNWVLQGIAVGLGYATVLLFHMMLMLPWDMVLNLQIPMELLTPLLLLASVSTVLSVIGAFFGQLLIQPLRLSVEGDRGQAVLRSSARPQ